MFCAKCGQEMIEEAKFCSNCGHPVRKNEPNPADLAAGKEGQYNSAEEAGSQNIQSKNAEDSGQNQYKEYNGYSQNSQYGQYSQGQVYKPVPEQKSKLVAGLLQIFLGGFGVGRFYLGYTGIGIAQLLTVWICGIGYIWGFIDGILILCDQVPTDANGVPLKE